MIGTPRPLTIAFAAIAATLIAVGLFAAPEPFEQKGSAPGPDVTVIYLQSVGNYGEDNGIFSYSVGTTSCNIGDAPLWWCDDPGDAFCDTDQHPVIAQNLYRLKEGRFEQIGMSWLKHGFLSLNTPDSNCGSCQGPPHGGDQLGIGCTDAYGAGLNGNRPLGMRSEVNPATGEFPFPYTVESSPSTVSQRIQVKESDLDPKSNPGARYWVEGHYIAADDAAAGNSNNNASYRQVTVNGGLELDVAGATVREQAAILAWPASDPGVGVNFVDVAGDGRFILASKASHTPQGRWHYEYALYNMTSDRSAGGFTVPMTPDTEVDATGFHDVDYHSGEPFDGTDWPAVVDPSGGTVSWSTTDFATDPDANALRWGTLYNFRLDAGTPPGLVNVEIGLFRPGSPASMIVASVGPTGEIDIFADGFESGDTTSWSSSTRRQ